MNEKDYIQDLKEIKDLMDRSSKFRSLNGLSGVLAGIFSLVGAYLGYQWVFSQLPPLSYLPIELTATQTQTIWIIALGIIGLTLAGLVFFSSKEAKKRKQKLWNSQSKRVLIHMGIPLIAGGLLSAILLREGFLGMLPSLTLLFFGVGLVNASHFTFQEIRLMGLAEIGLGLAAMWFVEWGLYFWAVGFGLLNIASGIFFQIRYNS
ncbi:MAG: hypothetical protein AAGA10_01820 [Bacteroidota bacterium]